MTDEKRADSISAQDIKRYSLQMEKVKRHIDQARNLTAGVMTYAEIIHAAAQLRLAIEEIVFSSLVSNRKALEEANRSLTKTRNMDAARKTVRSLNPDYWPKGILRATTDDKPEELVDRSDGLAEGSYVGAWGKLSSILHARTPYSSPPVLNDEATHLRTLLSQLAATLNEHTVLLDSKQEMLVCHMWADPVRVYLFGAVDE